MANIFGAVIWLMMKENVIKSNVYGQWHLAVGISALVLMSLVWMYILLSSQLCLHSNDNNTTFLERARKYLGDAIILGCPIQFGNYMLARLLQGNCESKSEFYKSSATNYRLFCCSTNEAVGQDVIVLICVYLLTYQYLIKTTVWVVSAFAWFIGLAYILVALTWPGYSNNNHGYTLFAYAAVLYVNYLSERNTIDRFAFMFSKNFAWQNASSNVKDERKSIDEPTKFLQQLEGSLNTQCGDLEIDERKHDIEDIERCDSDDSLGDRVSGPSFCDDWAHQGQGQSMGQSWVAGAFKRSYGDGISDITDDSRSGRVLRYSIS